MPWALFSIPSAKKAELDAALADDVVSRQSHKIRSAGALGGPADRTYVLIEGSAEAVRRAEGLLAPLGDRPPAAEASLLYQRFKDEEDAASAGMGLFFGDGA
ncbi:MAG: hypothetical protein ACLQD8_07890 [Thermoplasmata archaeon]